MICRPKIFTLPPMYKFFSLMLGTRIRFRNVLFVFRSYCHKKKIFLSINEIYVHRMECQNWVLPFQRHCHMDRSSVEIFVTNWLLPDTIQLKMIIVRRKCSPTIQNKYFVISVYQLNEVNKLLTHHHVSQKKLSNPVNFNRKASNTYDLQV